MTPTAVEPLSVRESSSYCIVQGKWFGCGGIGRAFLVSHYGSSPTIVVTCSYVHGLAKLLLLDDLFNTSNDPLMNAKSSPYLPQSLQFRQYAGDPMRRGWLLIQAMVDVGERKW